MKRCPQCEKSYSDETLNFWFLQRLKVEPLMDPLRGDARFEALVKRLNFPE